jgi:hypothetical protein
MVFDLRGKPVAFLGPWLPVEQNCDPPSFQMRHLGGAP